MPYRERIERMRRGKRRRRQRPEDILRRFVAESLENLEHLEDAVTAALLNAAVRLLANAERIDVLAYRRSFPVACYIAYALNQLELPAQLMNGVGGMDHEYARGLDARTPRRRQLSQLLARGRRARRGLARPRRSGDRDHRRPDVAAARAPRASPRIGDDGERPFRSLVEPICLAQALVVSVGHRIAGHSARTPTRRTAHGCARLTVAVELQRGAHARREAREPSDTGSCAMIVTQEQLFEAPTSCQGGNHERRKQRQVAGSAALAAPPQPVRPLPGDGAAPFFGPWKPNHAWAQAAQKKPLVIGLTMDAVGQYGASGMEERLGAMMAIKEFNEKGGVLGRPIEAIHMDTETTPATGSRVAERMITRNEAAFLIGALHSGVANAISQVAQKYGCIYLNTNSSSPTEAGKDCHRVKFVWDGNGTNFALAIVKNAITVNGKNWVMLTNDYVWGHRRRRRCARSSRRTAARSSRRCWCRRTRATSAPTSSRSSR